MTLGAGPGVVAAGEFCTIHHSEVISLASSCVVFSRLVGHIGRWSQRILSISSATSKDTHYLHWPVTHVATYYASSRGGTSPSSAATPSRPVLAAGDATYGALLTIPSPWHAVHVTLRCIKWYISRCSPEPLHMSHTLNWSRRL
jgi:hypothetical protein